MRKGSYLAVDCNGVNVEGGCLIVDRNRLYIKMMSPYEVWRVIDIGLDKQHLTETEEGEEELFDYAETVMAEMYRTIKLIEREPKMFQRLYVNFEAMVDGQEVRLLKKVFYSDTEREYSIRDMDARIYESYYKLFDKYITTKDEDILALRQSLTPQFLRQVMRKVFNIERYER